jgi:hypothetical protein
MTVFFPLKLERETVLPFKSFSEKSRAFIFETPEAFVGEGSGFEGAVVEAGDNVAIGLPVDADGTGVGDTVDSVGDGEVTAIESDLSGKGVALDVVAGFVFPHPTRLTNTRMMEK